MERKLWTGRGRTAKASDGANWSPRGAPRNGQRLLFGRNSSKDCEWDYDVAVSSLVIANAYKGRISLGTSQFTVRRHARVAGGILDLGGGVLTVRGRLYLDRGGTVQLNRGKLRMGRSGLLVDNGGTLLATGGKPVKIAAAVSVFAPEDQEAEVVLEDWTLGETVEKKLEVPGAEQLAAKGVLTEVPPPSAAVPAETVAAPPTAAEIAAAAPEEEEEAPPGKGLDMARLTAEDEGVKVTPVLNFQVLGGQYFFKGQKGNLTGNASLLAAPVVKFSDTWTMLPVYAGSYQGTKQVLDLVGAGSLFQQRMTHRLGARGVYTPGGEGPWRIKPGASARFEFLEETQDEEWGKGLFDSRKVSAGVEAEYVYREPFSVRASYDFALTRYPNYTSLESQQTFDFNGQPLARELVGGHTLDNQAHSLTLAGSQELAPGYVLEPSYVVLFQRYPEQRIVNAAGTFEREVRRDVTQLVDVTLRHPRQISDDFKLLASLGLGASIARSNQNSYDALNTRFIGGYYDFTEVGLRPGITALLGRSAKEEQPLVAGLSLSLSQRAYKRRPTQDAVGVYRAGRIRQTTAALNATVSVPMDQNFSLTGNLQYGRADSNMDFQQFYKYRYSTLNYLFGVSYQY